MKRNIAAVAAALTLASPAFAHRLDEYLQAIVVSVAKDRIQASMRMIPGVAVPDAVVSAADLNRDGVFSQPEQLTYARTVLGDLSIHVDGRALKPRLLSVGFPSPAEMKQGTGEIDIEFDAELPAGGPRRSVTIENRHRPRISVYLMNCLVPWDPNIRVLVQKRNQNQLGPWIAITLFLTGLIAGLAEANRFSRSGLRSRLATHTVTEPRP